VDAQAMRELFAQQQRAGFADLLGSEGAGSIRVTDRLLNAVVANEVRRSKGIRSVELRAAGADRVDVRIFLAGPSFLPPLNVGVLIERQALLPADPVLVLKLEGLAGLLKLAGLASSVLNVLPPGVTMQSDRVYIDIRVLLQQGGLGWIVSCLDELSVHADVGVVRVGLRARLR
jgi:hypothetical protein